MRTQLIKALDDIRASYWFVPLCLVLIALGFAFSLNWLAALPALRALTDLPFVNVGQAGEARTILSVIATSVLGVAGVAFSITIVAVSFASSNFGPRLIGNFMRDRGNQLTLGVFTGTFVFCLANLASFHDASSGYDLTGTQMAVPRLSVVFALVLALGCIGMLIYYFHHIAETINIENIIADIGCRLESRIAETFPASPDEKYKLESQTFEEAGQELELIRISSERLGYVQAISHDELLAIAQSSSLLVHVHYRPGDFVCHHDKVLSIWSNTPDAVPVEKLRSCFATGAYKTEHQNVLFLIEQLAEVIARALSPGVNDPFTAISCLNWYRNAIQEYIHSCPKPANNEDWLLYRVRIKPVSFARLCSVMFDQTRPYIVSDTNVLLHAMAVLAECAWQAQSNDHRDVLLQHLSMYHENGLQAQSLPADQAIINERFANSKKLLHDDSPLSGERIQTSWFAGSS